MDLENCRIQYPELKQGLGLGVRGTVDGNHVSSGPEECGFHRLSR